MPLSLQADSRKVHNMTLFHSCAALAPADVQVAVRESNSVAEKGSQYIMLLSHDYTKRRMSMSL